MKTALIRGASQGIGAAIADKLNVKKIKVILVSSSKNKFDKLVQMYLGISDHGNGGKIIIGEEIKNCTQKILIKLRLD